MPVDELQAKRDHINAKEEQAEAKLKEIHTLEQEIGNARKSHSLEDARAAFQAAVAELQQERERTAAAYVGMQLCDLLREQTREGASKALDHARHRFAAFTHDRYSIDLASDGSELIAYDHTHSKPLKLPQLSSEVFAKPP